MSDHVYKVSEIVGTSHKSADDAIKSAIARASKSLRNIRWFEVKHVRGSVDGKGGIQYQVTLNIGFTLDD